MTSMFTKNCLTVCLCIPYHSPGSYGFLMTNILIWCKARVSGVFTPPPTWIFCQIGGSAKEKIFTNRKICYGIVVSLLIFICTVLYIFISFFFPGSVRSLTQFMSQYRFKIYNPRISHQREKTKRKEGNLLS